MDNSNSTKLLKTINFNWAINMLIWLKQCFLQHFSLVYNQ